MRNKHHYTIIFLLLVFLLGGIVCPLLGLKISYIDTKAALWLAMAILAAAVFTLYRLSQQLKS